MNKGVHLTQVAGMADVCFLTFVRPPSIYSGDVVEWYAGARLDPTQKRWVKIDRKFVDANRAQLSHTALWDFTAPGAPRAAYLVMFSEAICRELDGFTHEGRKKFFKGLSLGSAPESCPGLVMKSLKTGFDALGIVHSAYSGLRAKAFTVADIKPYVERMVAAGAAQLTDMVYGGYQALKPTAVAPPANPQVFFTTWQLAADRKSSSPQLYGEHLKGVAAKHKPSPHDWKAWVGGGPGEAKKMRSPFKDGVKGYVIVSEYGFRADTRAPADIWSLGGMQPNAVRDDRQDLTLKRDKVTGQPLLDPVSKLPVRKELLDNYNHQASWGSDYSGYVSVSRSIRSAYGFFVMCTGPGVDVGYIYAARARDAVDVAATFTNPRYQEFEISVPGGIEWPDIVGWRKIKWVIRGVQAEWDSDVFLTTDTKVLPADKRRKILEVFSLPLRVIKP